MKTTQYANELSIECTTVEPTTDRPGSYGTYLVRLSPANRDRLKVKDGAYLKVSYGKASVLARLSVRGDLPDKTIRMDQTIRTAICLEKILQGTGKKDLLYSPNGGGNLETPIVIQPSNFRPHWLARWIKQQYLICIVHHAMAEDMEKPLARITKDSLEVIGIKSGDKVWLMSEIGRKSVRCLGLDPRVRLPLETMESYFKRERPGSKSVYEDLILPWITLDGQTRKELGVVPWQPIIVGRNLWQVLTPEAAAVAIGAIGGLLIVPEQADNWVRVAVASAGVAIALVFTIMKIRSRN